MARRGYRKRKSRPRSRCRVDASDAADTKLGIPVEAVEGLEYREGKWVFANMIALRDPVGRHITEERLANLINARDLMLSR